MVHLAFCNVCFRYAESTETKIKWSVDLFSKWLSSRNLFAMKNPNVQLSPILTDLEHMSRDELNYCLSRFVIKVRKQNGQLYPGKTLRELVLCMQFFLEKKGKCYKLLQDEDFIQLQTTLDNTMKDIAKKGVGIHVRQAKVISVADEEKLWKSGVLGSDSPTKLVHTLFYQLGLNLALRGGREHRELRVGQNSQLTLHTDSNNGLYLQYCQDISKTDQGGLKHIKLDKKCVRAYASENRDRCAITLYQKYLSKCPQNRPEPLYLRPLTKLKCKDWDDEPVWYMAQPIGQHTLSKMVKMICQAGSLEGYFTNHSLRASAASRLYNAGVDEQLIQETTGHKSIAVRGYKRTSDCLKRSISDILLGQNKKSATVSAPSDVNVQPEESKDETGKFSLTFNFNL